MAATTDSNPRETEALKETHEWCCANSIQASREGGTCKGLCDLLGTRRWSRPRKRDLFCSSVLPDWFVTSWLTTDPVASERREEASRRITAAYYRSFESDHLYFFTGHARRRLVVAEEKGLLSSRPFNTVEARFNLDYGNDQMAEHAIDERIIDRLGLFDPSDRGQSARYSVSLDLENEDSDWSFLVTVCVEILIRMAESAREVGRALGDARPAIPSRNLKFLRRDCIQSQHLRRNAPKTFKR